MKKEALHAGDFQAGSRAGKGIMLLPDGGVYTGDFAADKWEGAGMYEYPDGSCYVGEWQQGKKHGAGASCSLAHDMNANALDLVERPSSSVESNDVECRHILGQARWLPGGNMGRRYRDRHCLIQTPCILHARLFHKGHSRREVHV